MSQRVGSELIKLVSQIFSSVRKTGRAQVVTQICPRCRRGIPASEMDEHVRIELLDPKWREQKERAAAKSSGTNLISDETIAQNLKRISAFRTDIFDGDEIAQQAKVRELRELAKQKEDTVWDGHSTTILSVQQKAFSEGMKELQSAIQRRIAEEEIKEKIGPQAAAYSGGVGVVPYGVPVPMMGIPPVVPMVPVVPVPVAMPPVMVPPASVPVAGVIKSADSGMMTGRGPPPPPPPRVPPPPPPRTKPVEQAAAPEPHEDAPPPKRLKLEPTLPGFIPEEHFINMAKRVPITVQIRIQAGVSGEKTGWKIPDSMFLRIPQVLATAFVSEIKDKIAKETGWPASRQKLTLEPRAGFTGRHVLKDTMTAGYYNLSAGDTLELSVKERGGKK